MHRDTSRSAEATPPEDKDLREKLSELDPSDRERVVAVLVKSRGQIHALSKQIDALEQGLPQTKEFQAIH